MKKSKEFLDEWREQASELLDKGLDWLADQRRMPPVADGDLGDLVTRMKSLPLEPRHADKLVSLLKRGDLHLQEVALELIAAAVDMVAFRAEGEAELAIAAVLDRRPLDPWLLHAAIQVAAALQPGLSEAATLYAKLAELARRGPEAWQVVRFGAAPNLATSRTYCMESDIPAELHRVLRGASNRAEPASSARVAAVLPYLEERYGTKGLEPTLRAARLDEELERALKAVGDGHLEDAASSLESAASLSAQQQCARASEITALQELVKARRG